MNSNDKYQQIVEDAKELVELQEEKIRELEKEAMKRVEILNPTEKCSCSKEIEVLETKLAECIYSHDKMTRAYVDELEKKDVCICKTTNKLDFPKLKNIQIPTVAEQRKATPVFSGVLMYFPDAIREVAKCSQAGNDQHHKDKPLHWDRSKSGDELDALARHLMEAGTIDTDGVRHSAKVAWRALANLQKEIEKDNE